MIFVDYIQHHPLIAFIVGLSHLVLAEALHEAQIPVIYMQLFQIGAWGITIAVGLITIYGFFKKKIK